MTLDSIKAKENDIPYKYASVGIIYLCQTNKSSLTLSYSSLCVAKNQAVCHYSERLPTGPKPQTPPPTATSSSVLARSGQGRSMPEGREGKEKHHKPWGSVSEKEGVDQYPAGQMGEGDPSCTTLLPFKR